MFQSLKEFFLIPVEFFQRASKLTYCSLGIAAVVGVLYFGIMFGRRSSFVAAETYDKCDHPLHGRRYHCSTVVKWKVIFLLALCMVSYHLAYRQLPEWFPAFFRVK